MSTLPVTSGLVMHFESDVGVTTSGSTVTGWLDQSSEGNDLTASGNPQLVQNGLGGQPVIKFDGNGDILQKNSGVTGVPTTNGDRTFYAVVKYDGVGFGGVAWGAAAANNAFGLIVDNAGDLTVQGWGAGNDFVSTTAGTGQPFIVQSATLSSSALLHYKNNVQIDSQTHAFNTTSTNIVFGAEIGGSPQIDMDLAAVIAYDRALSLAEQLQVFTYLFNKYFTGQSVTEPMVEPMVIPMVQAM